MEPIIGETTQAGGNVIKDSDSRNFEADVIRASMETPIIVDFWAPWCGPCKTLGPMIEKAVRATRGKVKLVKINLDESPELQQALRIQSVPAVFAFDKGQPVDGFVGAQPESQIKAFIDKVAGAVGASPVEQALEQAKAALENKEHGAASALFGQILHHEPDNATAIAGLARCCMAAGELAEARAILDGVTEELADDTEIASALAALTLAEEATAHSGEAADLEARVAADPTDHQARFDLAMALFGADQRDAAVDELLEIMRRDRNWNDEAARTQLLKFFEAFGMTDPLTISARRRLSSILFS